MATPTDRPQPAVKGAGPEIEEVATGNLDKVRDILFGGQMRDYERRFVKLEERLARDTAELKEDVKKRLAALEEFIKNEADTLATRIKAEHDERTDSTKDLSRELHDVSKAFEKKTGQLDDQIARVQRELRQQVLDLNKHLTEEIQHKADEVLARLAQESHELRVDKADRFRKTTLAEALLGRAGMVSAAGSVERGTSASDFDPLEKTWKHSLRSSILHIDTPDARIHLIDTPGFPDFIGQSIGALDAVETAAIVV